MFNELVEKAKNGDRKAMEEIIEKLQPLLISSIRRYYNKPKEYEDLIQDGNIKIMESINDYDRDKAVYFLGYIKMNIKFLYLDKHKEKIHGSLNETLEGGQLERIDLLAGEDIDFLEDIIKKEEEIELENSFEILTPRQRRIVYLYYGKDMSIGQISSELGIAYRTVYNIKTRALKKLEKELKKEIY